APDGIPPFTVEDLSLSQRAFRRSDHVGNPLRWRTRCLATQGDRRNRHPHLEPDEMPTLVQREIATRGVGMGVVLLKAVTYIRRFAFHGHPHTHAYIVGNTATIGLQA